MTTSDALATIGPEELEQLAATVKSAAFNARTAERHAETAADAALASIAASLAVIARLALTDPDWEP